MKAMQTEVTDSVGTEHANGTITTAGTPVSITSTKTIHHWIVQNPSVGPYATSNRSNYLKVSFDGGTKWFSVSYGSIIGWPGMAANNTIKVDGNANGVGYEILMATEEYSS